MELASDVRLETSGGGFMQTLEAIGQTSEVFAQDKSRKGEYYGTEEG